MIVVKMKLDNKFAADMTPEEFVKYYYLTVRAKEDLVKIEVEQTD
ncbi:MAG: hypothetical protein Q7R33_04840 [Nitrosarchaeum sp.]|nr:hypothetical protein [Nitrosarchaeum sp.]